jgi:hypothetical protein
MHDDGHRVRHTAGADLIIPVAASLYAVYYMYSVWDFPPEAQRSGIFMASLLLFLSALLFLRTGIRLARGTARWEFASVLGPAEGRASRLAFFALILGYLFFVSWGGFTLTTFLFLFLGSYAAGLRPLRKAAVFGVAGALGGWLFFIVILQTRFPRGPFEDLVSWGMQTWN